MQSFEHRMAELRWHDRELGATRHIATTLDTTDPSLCFDQSCGNPTNDHRPVLEWNVRTANCEMCLSQHEGFASGHPSHCSYAQATVVTSLRAAYGSVRRPRTGRYLTATNTPSP